MKADIWVWIPNWFGDGKDAGFQHYKDRDPIWIKNYTRLLSHDAYMDLSYHQRGILHSVWMEYARSSRRLRGDTLSLTRRLGHRVTTRDIESLTYAGFIEIIASTTLATRLQDASPRARPRDREEAEVETEVEEEPPLPPVAKEQDPDELFADTDTEPEPEPQKRWAGSNDIQRLVEADL